MILNLNSWGSAKNVKVEFTLSEETAEYGTLIDGESVLGDIGEYGFADNYSSSEKADGIRIKVSEDAPNDLKFSMNICAAAENCDAVLNSEYSFLIQNVEKLPLNIQ